MDTTAERVAQMLTARSEFRCRTRSAAFEVFCEHPRGVLEGIIAMQSNRGTSSLRLGPARLFGSVTTVPSSVVFPLRRCVLLSRDSLTAPCPSNPAEYLHELNAATFSGCLRFPKWERLPSSALNDPRFLQTSIDRAAVRQRARGMGSLAEDSQCQPLPRTERSPACVSPYPGSGRGWSVGVYTAPQQSLWGLRDPFQGGGRRELEGGGVAAADMEGICNPVIWRWHADDTRGRAVKYVADPFLILEGGTYHMFFELMITGPQLRGIGHERQEQGTIGHATSKDGYRWRYDREVLVTEVHNSFPAVFKHKGQFYMTPESAKAGEVRLYRAHQFPYDWRLHRVLLSGDYYADSSLLRHNRRWWLFTYGGAQRRLLLFHAPTLDGPFLPHALSPTLPGIADAHHRPAGKVLAVDGKLYRFSQDTAGHYGARVFAHEINTLTPTAYRETLLFNGNPLFPRPTARSSASPRWNVKAHHADYVRRPDGSWLVVSDGDDRGASCNPMQCDLSLSTASA